MPIERGENPEKEPTYCDKAYSLVFAGFNYARSSWDAIIRTLDLIYEDYEEEEIKEDNKNLVKWFLKRYVKETKLVEREPSYRVVTLNGLINNKELTELNDEEDALVNSWIDEFVE